MKFVDAAATRAALPFTELIAALESRLIEGCTVPPRHVHDIGGRGTSLIMPAWQQRYLGIKTVNIFPGNSARGLPGLFSTYIGGSHAGDGEPRMIRRQQKSRRAKRWAGH